jgi:hypothetical protein
MPVDVKNIHFRGDAFGISLAKEDHGPLISLKDNKSLILQGGIKKAS